MKQRCYYRRGPTWYLYGDRGVSVCDRWRNSFAAFLADMGPRPGPEYSIDRYPDPFGDYRPGNTRWATPVQQQANRRDRYLAKLAARRARDVHLWFRYNHGAWAPPEDRRFHPCWL
jgi:hypothetical protein